MIISLFIISNKTLKTCLRNSFFVNCEEINPSNIPIINPNLSEYLETNENTTSEVYAEFESETTYFIGTITILPSISFNYLHILDFINGGRRYFYSEEYEMYFSITDLIQTATIIKNDFNLLLEKSNLNQDSDCVQVLKKFEVYLLLMKNIIKAKNDSEFLNYCEKLENYENFLDIQELFKCILSLCKLNRYLILKKDHFFRLMELSWIFNGSFKSDIPFSLQNTVYMFLTEIELLDQVFTEKFVIIKEKFKNFL
ncbi:hypothetical protein A0H76_654 [Hepatospora eriocheir]|uniref:Uncharacterized protein n=1 Tax=Hepatospora eriocheir TaxID=1081669 RepID=A0A1X0QIQ7_9MICR|nr:hypothetical protein A0H76_654 [Hepatospora eriocheir]